MHQASFHWAGWPTICRHNIVIGVVIGEVEELATLRPFFRICVSCSAWRLTLMLELK